MGKIEAYNVTDAFSPHKWMHKNQLFVDTNYVSRQGMILSLFAKNTFYKQYN